MAWLRLYDDILDDPKVQRLPPVLFKHLINLWCIAKRCDGYLPPMDDLAFRLRAPEKQVAEMTGKLIDADLIDILEDGRMQPHNWNERQFVSDNVTSRVKKHREKRQSTVPRNDDETFDGTHQSRAEQNRTESPPSAADGDLNEVTRDWHVSSNIAEHIAAETGLSRADIDAEAGKFTAHCQAHGRGFVDIDAGFRLWCLRDNGRGRSGGGEPRKSAGNRRSGTLSRAEAAREVILEREAARATSGASLIVQVGHTGPDNTGAGDYSSNSGADGSLRLSGPGWAGAEDGNGGLG
jgi:hypothetical protein